MTSVTLALTSYNAEATIGRALKAACALQGPIVEILVIDDASQDGSASVVQSYVEQDARIRLLALETNLGVGGARALLVAEAKGEFLAFLDDDDVSLPHRITDQLAAIERAETQFNTKLVACYATGKRLYANGYQKPLPALASQGTPIQGEDLACYLLFLQKKLALFYGSGTPTCSLCARTETFKAAGSFDPKFRRLEDADFAIRLALMGGVFIGTQAISFIQHSTGGADKAPEKNLKNEIQLSEKHKEFLIAKRRYYYSKNWPYLRYYHFTKRYHMLLATLFLIFLHNPIKTCQHFFSTAPKRLIHEAKILAKPAN